MSSTTSAAVMANDLGSVAALRLALQTLAERCEKLQSRLDVVEKENLTIKSRCACQAVDGNATRVNVKELTCKKQQLLEYLQIVTDENCTLWTKLSSLDNPAVCSNDKIKPKNSLAIVDNYLKFDDADMKINSNCIMDTNAEDLTSLQKGSDDESWPMLLTELNLYKEKLTLAKHLLADQNYLILNITSRFNLLAEEVKLKKPTSEYQDAETLTNSVLDSNQSCICGIRAKPDNHSICPLCKLYIVGTEGDKMFDKLVEHVSSHFPDEEPETIIDSLSGHY